jgi:hypothetical protein
MSMGSILLYPQQLSCTGLWASQLDYISQHPLQLGVVV